MCEKNKRKSIYEFYSKKELIARHNELEKEIRDRNDLIIFVGVVINLIGIEKMKIEKIVFTLFVVMIFKFLMFHDLKLELKKVEAMLNIEESRTTSTIGTFIIVTLGLLILQSLLFSIRDIIIK